MNYTVLCVFLIGLNMTSAKYYIVKKEFPEQWIEQNLDHIHQTSNKTWQMRYFSNGKLYRNGGPMFIMLGGWQSISQYLLHVGYFHDLAQRKSAFLFKIEHRFFGKSRPTPDLSIENLKYLTTKQVLADIAHFITTMKIQNPNLRDSKVILAGCCYAGSLAALMKEFYPELVDGVWASSAPLMAKLDFPEFVVENGKAIRNIGGEQCYQKIKRGIRKIGRLFDEGKFESARKLLKMCKISENYLDVSTIFGNIASTIITAVNDRKILSACKEIISIEDDMRAVAEWVLSKSKHFQNGCYNVTYRKIVETKSNIHNFEVSRQILYQKCNEFGWFLTTAQRRDKLEQPFGDKVRALHYNILCQDLFGENYTKEYLESKIKKENEILFGDIHLTAKNIFLSYGEYDGWKQLSIKDQANVSIIPDAFQCEDMYKTEIVQPRNQQLVIFKRKFFEFLNEILARK